MSEYLLLLTKGKDAFNIKVNVATIEEAIVYACTEYEDYEVIGANFMGENSAKEK